MKQEKKGSNRRDFITKTIPACALASFGGSKLLAFAEDFQDVQDKHKFDTEMERKLTFKQLFGNRYGEFIRFALALEKELGSEKLHKLLRQYSSEGMKAYGKSMAERSGDDSFEAYVSMFRDPDNYKNTLTKVVVEDSETVFELKVTECIWATTFLEAGAGEIGYSAICNGDYAWASGFNPEISMTRDKTLMQGDKICNHRYIWKKS